MGKEETDPQPPLGSPEHGGYPYTRNIPVHPPRSDSPEYRRSRDTMHDLVDTVDGFFLGPGPYEDHHGGGLWLKDADGWFLVRNMVGIEWSAQFCADPAKVDQLRINAGRLYAAFPEAVEALEIRELLDTPITDAAGVALWTDSICNASVPLPREDHTGVLPPMAGVHGYPSPVAEIQRFKYEWFELWQYSPETQEIVAVTPVASAEEENAGTRAIFAAPVVPTEGPAPTILGAVARGAREEEGADLTFPPEHPFSQAAFRRRPSPT